MASKSSSMFLALQRSAIHWTFEHVQCELYFPNEHDVFCFLSRLVTLVFELNNFEFAMHKDDHFRFIAAWFRSLIASLLPTGIYRIIRSQQLDGKYSRVLHRCEVCKLTTMRSCAWTNRPLKVWPNWKYCKYIFLIYSFIARSRLKQSHWYRPRYGQMACRVCSYVCLLVREREVKWGKSKSNKFNSTECRLSLFHSFHHNKTHKHRHKLKLKAVTFNCRAFPLRHPSIYSVNGISRARSRVW